MKKMRKLIPAFAMLMVAAIMMTTASFAWFTMNENVTATGMQIQAQAAGSLVISKSPLTYEATGTEADFTEDGLKKLKAMTWTTVGGTEVWAVPADSKTVNTVSGKVDPATGLAAIDWTKEAAADYFFDKVMYIGSAGDTLTGKRLTLDLSAVVSAAGTATKAYSVAIYVLGNVSGTADALGTPATALKPAAIIHVDTAESRNTVTLTTLENGTVIKAADLGTQTEKGFTIPSIVGVGDQNENIAGLKVVLRVFVDGDLESVEEDKVAVPTGEYTYTKVTNTNYNPSAQYFAPVYTYTAETVADADFDTVKANLFTKNGDVYTAVADDATFDADETYYTRSVTSYVAANLGNLTNVQYDADDATKIVSATMPADWYTRSAVTELENYKYVNSENVPTAGSSLEVEFSASDKPAAQG